MYCEIMMPAGDKSKYVVISLFSEMDEYMRSGSSDTTAPNGTVYHAYKENASGKNANEFVINKVKEHVKKYGTLDELKISGHGSKQSMGSGNQDNQIDIPSILEDLGKLEKELGKKITNRIVFSGCSTFSELSNNEVKFYREYADKHNIELVGTTSIANSNVNTGRFVQFNANGGVVRDKLDTRFNPIALWGDDRSWINEHLGKTQTEAEALLRREIINQTSSLIKLANDADTGDREFNNDKKNLLDNIAKNITKKDRATDKTDVLLAADNKAAIVSSSDGMVRSFGAIKLHPLTEQEKSSYIKEFESYINKKTDQLTDSDKTAIKNVEEGLNSNINAGKSGRSNAVGFISTPLDDNTGVLLVTGTGGYEVIKLNGKEATAKTVKEIEELARKSLQTHSYVTNIEIEELNDAVKNIKGFSLKVSDDRRSITLVDEKGNAERLSVDSNGNINSTGKIKPTGKGL